MLLTDAEHEAIDMAGDLYTFIAEAVMGNGPTREADMAELAHHIHGIQHAVMAQAAARAFPERYRLLGLTLPSRPRPEQHPLLPG